MTAPDAVAVKDASRCTAGVGSEIRENLPPIVLDGLARRRLVALGQPCPAPCGAALVLPNRQERRWARRQGRVALHEQVERDLNCPVICLELLSGRWSQ